MSKRFETLQTQTEASIKENREEHSALATEQIQLNADKELIEKELAEAEKQVALLKEDLKIRKASIAENKQKILDLLKEEKNLLKVAKTFESTSKK